MAKQKLVKAAPQERKLKYNTATILSHWEKGKSIKEIAEAMKPISRVYVHRVLTLKFPKQYAEGRKVRDAAKAGPSCLPQGVCCRPITIVTSLVSGLLILQVISIMNVNVAQSWHC
jgi:hypothetical protein